MAELYNLWKEFEAAETVESQWVKVVDRLLPFMLNLSSDGKNWIEQDISKDQVIAINQPIAQHYPALFAWMEEQMDIAVTLRLAQAERSIA